MAEGLGNARHVLRVRPWSLHALLLVLLAIGLATALRMVLSELGATLYFATYFPAVLAVSVFAGAPGAILTAAFANLIVWWAFISPPYEFSPLGRSDYANFATFWLSAAMTIWLSQVYRKTLASLLKSEQARELLIGELNHRAGNNLSIMQAIINGTVANDSERQTLTDRIQALARANELVSRASSGHLPLKELIRNEAEPYASPDRLQVQGPQVELGGETARSLALVLHELMTNAAKYGALSNGHGKLEIRWSYDEGRCLLRWTEIDGPAVITPTRLGFGSRMMKASLSQIAGTIEPEFRSAGYSCLLTFSTRPL